jgi:uncharacterized protein YsxB (DUF464 family)
MTTVSFHTKNGRITGFDCAGHSGHGVAGEDIVCAAVTSVIRFTECAVNDVLALGAAVSVGEQKADLTFRLPEKLEQEAESTCQTLLTAMMVYLDQLHQEYPENITVMEV